MRSRDVWKLMSDQQQARKGEVTAPKSVSELIAMALAMEREAAARYDELAAEMVRHDNPELADLFEGLAVEERKHEAYIGRWLGPRAEEPTPVEFHWQSPETINPDEKDEAGGVYLMTPYRALRLAVHNEERAFAFFSNIAAVAGDAAVREQAEALAKEELEHVVRLRLERRRAWRAESQSAVSAAAPGGVRAVRSLAALLRRAHAIEGEALAHCDAIGKSLEKAGDADSARLFKEIAEGQTAWLTEIERLIADTGRTPAQSRAREDHVEGLAEAVQRIGSSAPRDALRLVLSEAEEAFDFYAATAEQSADQAMMEQAQRFAERALNRLKRIRDHLDRLETFGPNAGSA